jgi:hypothetical protein
MVLCSVRIKAMRDMHGGPGNSLLFTMSTMFLRNLQSTAYQEQSITKSLLTSDTSHANGNLAFVTAKNKIFFMFFTSQFNFLDDIFTSLKLMMS